MKKLLVAFLFCFTAFGFSGAFPASSTRRSTRAWDANAITYFNRAEGYSGVFAPGEKIIYNDLQTRMTSFSSWSKLQIVGAHITQDTNGGVALVKVPGGTADRITLTAGLPATSFHRGTGFKGDGTTSKATNNFIANANGVTGGNESLFLYSLCSAPAGIPITSTANLWVFRSSNLQAVQGGSGISMTWPTNGPELMTITTDSTLGKAYIGNNLIASITKGTSDSSGGMQFWNVGGGNLSDASILAWAVGTGVTAAEVADLASAYKAFGKAMIANSVTNTKATIFGDSIVAGSTGLTNSANKWSTLLCAILGLTEDNEGISGTVLQNSTSPSLPAANNGRDTFFSRLIAPCAKTKIIALGVNDYRFDYWTYSVQKYEQQMTEIVSACIDYGTDPSDLTIVVPYYAPASTYNNTGTGNGGSDNGSAAGHAAYTNACNNVAIRFHCWVYDAKTCMADNGGDTLMVAGDIHPNDAGHFVIAHGFTNVLYRVRR